MSISLLRGAGSGKISVDSRYSAPGMIRALLYNFDVDSDTIKTEHRSFLMTKVAPLLQGDRGHVWMQGSSSKTGTNSHNMELSKRRVNNIAAVLRSFRILDRQMQLDAVGEGQAQAHKEEDETDRAVALIVIPMAKESFPPPKRIPSPPSISTEFKIRMVGSMSVTVVASVEYCSFQIVDKKNNLTCFYSYCGFGGGGGIWDLGPVSSTMKGPWNDFKTNSAIRVSQFQGSTRFTTGGVGSLTWNYLTIYGLPEDVETVPTTLSIQTGFTVGVGATSTIGTLILKPREEMIYGGD